MFTISKNYIHKKYQGRSRGASPLTSPKETKHSPIPFKPSYINVTHYAKHRDCSQIIIEHLWLGNVKMFENPMLTEQLVKADYETLTIQLSSEVMQQDISLQRDIFIRVLCQFLAIKLFHDIEQGEAYKLLVKRYSIKRASSKSAIKNHKTK